VNQGFKSASISQVALIRISAVIGEYCRHKTNNLTTILDAATYLYFTEKIEGVDSSDVI
jgi:hypothetical protein